ncbi:hypothetical protein QR680_007251 [Steinernema hermaphroditum]|uniref:Uncharacterized protein n=1 Tax=Steinernema hermaphroditum TaxID=289476 RepID=A0AA39LYT4_9BILA|nr:hypothetical protein QR680_007251 [Steinernema hermaphroditum]
MQTLVIDNGSHTVKAGFTTSDTPMVVHNSVVKAQSIKNRVFAGPEFEKVKERVSLTFTSPFEKGYITNWGTQMSIWDPLFGEDCLNIDPKSTRLMLTDPLDVLQVIKDKSPEIVFEVYGFQALKKAGGPVCVGIPLELHPPEPHLCLVVDCGHLATHFVPMMNGQILKGGVKQLRLGGKHLTDKLKEWISYRHLNVQNDVYLVNECKEKSCFVSQNFSDDERTIALVGLLIALKMIVLFGTPKNNIVCDYTLPDFYELYEGVLHEPNSKTVSKYIYAQSFKMGMERIAVPEIMFNPNDIGVNSLGVAEGIWHTLQQLPEKYHGRILKNIILVGGTTKFPGFKKKLETDLRSMVPAIYNVEVRQPENPDTHIWQCAKRVAEFDEDPYGFVTKEEYYEHGLKNCLWRFDRNTTLF